MYLLSMNIMYGVELYFIMKLVINFDFVFVKLNGGWLVLVSVDMKKMMNIGNSGN